MRLKASLAVLLLVLALLGSLASGEGTRATPLTEYEMLRLLPPGRLDALIGGVPDSQGLTGGNSGNGGWLEAGGQRGACRQVIAAVVAGDLARADNAWRGIDTAFAHQLPSGGFEATMRANGESAKPFPAAVETAFFFLQELGRAILVIQESPYEAHFHDRIVAVKPKMRLACAFILSGYDTIIAGSTKAVNRIFIAAKAFGLCGKVLDDPELIATSHRLVRHALTRRDTDGVFIEMGGRDSSYNVVSILMGEILALHVPMPELDGAFEKAEAWELTRILPSGEIDVSANTRTGVNKEFSYTGEPKHVNTGEIVQALEFYGLIHGDTQALAAADRVFAAMNRPRAEAR